MCALENSRFPRIIHQSIIREIKSTGSRDSGCDSLDELNHQGSSILFSAQTVPERFEHDNNPTASSCIRDDQRPVTSCSPSSLPQHDDSPSSFPSITPYRSHSTGNLSLLPLRETTTGDSGTDDSIPTETSERPRRYEVVPVFGQPLVVLMANRYEMDASKVAEYRSQKRPASGSIFNTKPAHSIFETTSRSSSRNSTESKKPHKILSFLLKPFKSSSTNRTPLTPLTRHHSSHDILDEHH